MANKKTESTDKETVQKTVRRTVKKSVKSVEDDKLSSVKTPKKTVKKSVKDTEQSKNEQLTIVNKSDNKSDYYTLDRILNENADYNLIVGERGNGKTYAVQKYLIERFLTTGEQCFLLRRWVEDIKNANAQNFWDGNLLNKLGDMSNGRFTNIVLRNNKYIAVTYDDKGKPIIDDLNTIGYVWDVNESERLKGQSFPNVTNIVYEEFISLSQMGYIPNETTHFLNIVSTIVRDRVNVRIWLLGNTVNPYNPYFIHFGIKGLELKQGQIWTATDFNTGCKVAVEFCEKRRKGSLYGTSAKYFAFGNKDGSTDMIVSGQWQIPDYPTRKFKQKDSRFKLAVKFDEKLMFLHLMVENNGKSYLFVQNVKPTTTLSKSIWVLDLIQNDCNNYYSSFQNLPVCDLTNRLIGLLNNNKIWFDDKMTGSYFYNFMSQSTMSANRRIM